MNTGCTLLLGMFDGVHLGHRALIMAATALNRPVVAYTFRNHPMEIVGGGRIKPTMLMEPEEKRQKLFELGVDEVAMDVFDERLAATPEHVYLDMLIERFAPRAVVAGYNHTFGAGGKGNSETILALARERGFEAHILPQVSFGGVPVSSTLARELIAAGDMPGAARILAEPYTLSGIIEHDRGLGSQMGFPTANISPPDKLIPPFGVYATRAKLNGLTLPGVTNIGVKPTVTDSGKVTVETHLIGFEGDVYGKRLTLELLMRQRGECRFASAKELSEQIRRDMEAALMHYEV